MANETGTRVLVAAVGIPIVVGLIFLGGWPLAALLAAVAVFAAREFYAMAEKKGARPLRLVGCVVAVGFVALAALAPGAGPERVGFGALLTLAVLAISALAIWVRGVEGEPLLSISTTVMGAVYTGALLSFALFLRHLPGTAGPRHGTALVFAPILLTWTSDTFAYFVGRAWGTRKLIPRVSPGKTVQGAAGAVVGSMLVALAYAQLLDRFPTYRLSALEALLFGLVISVTAQLGDLVESLLKRDAGVKDSGTLLPGHGGALDRFDSLLFTLPLAYLFLRHWVGPMGGGW
ncbi:MAG TPA: phosphatidate cytidylyltransferase [Longimicrobiaceae bacterium]|nr:phosphatidate cytidylyltransferase [Longimicrobiaceae bacterium]